MGCPLLLHCSHKKFQWLASRAILSWVCRGCIFCENINHFSCVLPHDLLIFFPARLPLPLVSLVYKEGISETNRTALRRLVNLRCILWSYLCRYHERLGRCKRNCSMAMAFHHRGRFDGNISLFFFVECQRVNLPPRSLWLCSPFLLFQIFPERHPG